MQVRITESAFDPHAEAASFAEGRSDAGALVSFVGYCRDATAGRAVSELYLDHYPGFTEPEIARIAEDVGDRFDLKDLLVIHRVGAVAPGEAIVLVATLAAHRAEAFAAASALMDYLKTDAPLWKKEAGPDGTRWIEPTSEDHARRAAIEKVTS
jgi:molybdopterin synthase catalytic subunit